MRVALTVLLLAVPHAGAQTPKHVAAPPEDVRSGLVALPDPADLGVVSGTALLPVDWRPDPAGGWRASVGFATFADHEPSVVVIARGGWSARLDANGSDPVAFDPTPAGAQNPRFARLDGRLPGELADVPATRLTFHAGALAPATHTLALHAPNPDAAFVLIDPGSDATLYTHPTGLRRVVGEPIGLVPETDRGRITRALAEVRDPAGGITHASLDPDGVVRFTPDLPGDHAVRVECDVLMPDGRTLTLTTQHLVHAARPAPALTLADQSTGVAVTINLGPGRPGQRTVTAAEVWGRRDSQAVPVCWIAQVGEGERTLALDTRWIALAGVDPGSLELRNVRSHEVESYCLVAYTDRILLRPMDAGAVRAAPAAPTRDMLTGPSQAVVAQATPVPTNEPRAAPPGHRLFLVHGYCSGGNPFTASDFAGDVAVFNDANQNRTHDAFAQLILAQGSTMKSFGVAAHSQGGMAALHLDTFYWSGLDWARGERLIQSVGSPYQGTALAGNAAVLGQIFGSGCGSQPDMTYDGSAAWLSLIPSWARADVWYWTTSFTDRPFVYDYCNIITDLLLSDPNDGVIERSAGQLTGAHNMGHREGWCHTSGMRDPAQCTDASRNTEIDQKARR